MASEMRRGPGDGLLGAVLLGAVLLVMLLGTAVALAGSWGGASWVLDLTVGAVVGGIALGRIAPRRIAPGRITPGRRHPAASSLAGSAVAVAGAVVAWAAHLPHEPGPATVLGLAVLTASAIRRDGPRRSAVPVGCGLLVVLAAGLGARPYAEGLDVITVSAALGWLGAVAAGLALRLRDAQRRATLDGVRRDERLELARELHDVAAHHLTGLVLQAQAARIVARRDVSRLDGELAAVETAGAGALAAMRSVVGLLRAPSPSSLADGAPVGEPSLDELIRTFASRPGAPVVRCDVDDGELPPAVRGTVYRVVQEALTNVVRHAPRARHVDITVRRHGDELTVAVADDGPVPVHPAGYGLIGMAERVQALGGRLEAGPRFGGGWETTARVRPVR